MLKNCGWAVPWLLALLACSGRPVTPPKATSPAPRASAAAAPQLQYFGGDGGSAEQAVVIANAPNEAAGIRAEYTWLKNKYPGYVRQSQSLLTHPPRFYDVLQIILPDGSPTTVYFDISGYFGTH